MKFDNSGGCASEVSVAVCGDSDYGAFCDVEDLIVDLEFAGSREDDVGLWWVLRRNGHSAALD